MADPSDKNNQPRRQGGEENKQPTKTSKSDETEREEEAAPSRPQQEQQQQQQGATAGRPPARSPSPLPPPPLTFVAARAIRLTRQFLQETARTVLALPLGQRVLLVADKALHCAIQALLWLDVPPDTVPIDEDVEHPPPPAGLSLAEQLKPILEKVQSSVRMAALFLNFRIPGNKEMVSQLMSYRRELLDLQMATRPSRREKSPERSIWAEIPTPQYLTVEQSAATKSSDKSSSTSSTSSSDGTAPITTSITEPINDDYTRWTEIPPPQYLTFQQPTVATPSETSSTFSSTSSSDSTASITEEVVQRYFSPPRFIEDWKKREEEGKHTREDERKDSETQEGDQRPATTMAEGVSQGVGQPSTSSSAEAAATEEGSAQPDAGDSRRPPTKASKRMMFMNLFGVKIA